jgi:hypothetical protein
MAQGIHHIGKIFLIIGIMVAVVGLLLLLSSNIPWLGRLPGDILIRKKNYTFYFPFATGIVISVLLTLLFWMFGKN